ncbi:MAG: stalk domain-containing protein, partial [Defluviitaleaceae bacterium]|nr:stalk domain-containing protein [Defluviitaleaceae bacterium]
FNLNNPFMQGVVPYEDDFGGDGQLFRNFSTGALYVVNDPTATVRNAANTASYVVYGNVDLQTDFGVSPMVFAHPGSWTLDSNSGQGAGRTKFPTPGAAFPRYAHTSLGLLPAPATGTGHGQRPAAGGTDPGQHLVAASQQVGDGTVLVFASNFFSNFDVRAELDFYGQLPNANFTISENILRHLAPEVVITDIADVHAAAYGQWFTIEGIATSGLQVTGAGSAENRGFMNAIYIQDETAGINLFEVTENNAAGLVVGQRVRAHGFVSSYQGERQLTVHLGGSVQIVDTALNPIAPDPLTVADVLSPANTGWLSMVEGMVSDVIMQPGTTNTILQFTVTDAHGAIPVYIRDYITPGVDLSFVEDGATVRVAGFASIGELAYGTGPRKRVRDRNEIVLIAAPGQPVAPSFTSANALTVLEGTAAFLTLAATGTAPITFAVAGAPAGVTIIGNVLTVADTVAVGVHTFTITATNAAGAVTQTFTLTITADDTTGGTPQPPPVPPAPTPPVEPPAPPVLGSPVEMTPTPLIPWAPRPATPGAAPDTDYDEAVYAEDYEDDDATETDAATLPSLTAPPPPSARRLIFTAGRDEYLLGGQHRTGVGTPFIDPATDRMMIPLRTLAEALGLEVEWENDTRSAIVHLPTGRLVVPADDMLPDGMGSAMIVDDRVFVPLRFVMYAFEADVTWDSANRAAVITW